MLALSRKLGEKVTIIHDGEKMEFTVFEIRHGGTVRLSFDAPKSYRIVRSELRIREPVDESLARLAEGEQ